MTWDERYRGRVQLLVDVLPAVAAEARFALKGGTAINLFEHDLPRLSVDIDLTWLPVGEFAKDARDMAAALEGIGARLASPPLQLTVRPSSAKGAAGINRLIVSRGASRIQIETTPVMRGTVHPVREMRVRPSVEKEFGFASMQVLDFADLYAGKLAAALSRQHPRDLFDVGLLLDTHGLDERLWRTFLVYLTCSSKPAAEMLAPNEPVDLAASFDTQFRGMTSTPSSAGDLLRVRARLLHAITERLDSTSCAFLESVETQAPDFDLLGFPQAAVLPGVLRKLQNLGQRSAAKRASDYQQLSELLGRIGRR